MNYIAETLKFIESDEMREYLRTRLDWLGTDWRGRNLCGDIVSQAPAPLEMKVPALELIAEQTECNPEHDFCDPAKKAELARYALAERHNNIPGAAYLLCQYNSAPENSITAWKYTHHLIRR